MADKKKVANRFVGMDNEELQSQYESYEQCIKQHKKELVELHAKYERKVSEINKTIKEYENALRCIADARKLASAIQYITVIEVVKGEVEVDNPKRRPYESFKQKVVYSYSVLTCNAQNMRYARNHLFYSCKYDMTQRQSLLENLIKDIQQYKVDRVVLCDGIKLSKATLQKYCKDIVSLETNIYGF